MDPGVLIVTGGSRGIGAATARLAAREGWAVCLSYLERANEANAVVRDIRDAGGSAIAVQADVGNERDVAALFEAARDQLGPITGLVNNAAITGGASTVATITAAALEAVLRTNVNGCFYCAREGVRHMAYRNGGRGGAIVNLSTIAVNNGAPGLGVHYAASKGAVDVLTRGLAAEVAAEGIRVNAVRPGLIDTEMHATVNLPNRARDLAPAIPLKRAGQPDEVAAAIVWLLSSKASYVTGALIDVTGGR